MRSNPRNRFSFLAGAVFTITDVAFDGLLAYEYRRKVDWEFRKRHVGRRAEEEDLQRRPDVFRDDARLDFSRRLFFQVGTLLRPPFWNLDHRASTRSRSTFDVC